MRGIELAAMVTSVHLEKFMSANLIHKCQLIVFLFVFYGRCLRPGYRLCTALASIPNACNFPCNLPVPKRKLYLPNQPNNMKNFLCLLSFAFSFAAQSQARLTITIQNRNNDSVVIYNQSQSFKQVLHSKGSKFEMTFTPKETTYYLTHGGEWAQLYLKKDSNLAITFDGQKVMQTVHFEGKDANENNFLAKYQRDWIQFGKANAFYQTKRNYSGFKQAFDEHVAEVDKQMKTGKFEPAFVDLMHKKQAESLESYKDIFREIGVLKDKPMPIDMMGKPAPAFEYENSKGGTTSLRDLKGKYVFVDLWASWCKPCIAEFPNLQKLEERYAGKNITFVGISLDKPESRTKWKKILADKHLDGLQLIADKDFNSDFVKAFNVQAIPHFILIAPNGIVVQAQALYPSDPNLVKQLDKILK
jgi:thiol-disulfide isomerase/thioredoxin